MWYLVPILYNFETPFIIGEYHRIQSCGYTKYVSYVPGINICVYIPGIKQKPVVVVGVCLFFLSFPIGVGLAGAPPWAVSAPDLAVGTWAWV